MDGWKDSRIRIETRGHEQSRTDWQGSLRAAISS
jgi:hypothetical protein